MNARVRTHVGAHGACTAQGLLLVMVPQYWNTYRDIGAGNYTHGAHMRAHMWMHLWVCTAQGCVFVAVLQYWNTYRVIGVGKLTHTARACAHMCGRICAHVPCKGWNLRLYLDTGTLIGTLGGGKYAHGAHLRVYVWMHVRACTARKYTYIRTHALTCNCSRMYSVM